MGRVLRPFSFGHLLALEAAGLDIGALARMNAGDLILLAEICSLDNPLDFDVRARWVDKLRAWRLSLPGYRALVLAQMSAYLADYIALPEFWEKEHGGKGLTAPAILARIACLLSYSNLTYREIISLPLGQAIWLQAAIAEQRGADVQIVSERDRELMRELENEQG
jgi:hypothetical protein